MRLRKWRKYSLIFLMGLLGLILMVFVVLNLPFSQRFATKKVNQILSSSSVPIHLDAIRKIMPGSVNIQGIVISGQEGDTIISVGELEADIRLISLLRSNVMLKEVVLDGALVELARKNSAEKLNIAAAFQSGKLKDAAPVEKPPAKWKISIRKGTLSNIHFQMNDSLSGIHIAQDASEIEIGSFRISLPEREIFCRSLFLGDADGLVNMTPRMLPPKKKKGSPWNLGFLKLALDDVDFIFSQAADSLSLETRIGKGRIRANKLELLTRTADFKLISLDKSIVTLQTGSASKKQKKQEDDREGSFQWNIRSENIEIKNSAARLGSNPWDSFKEIDVRVDDLRLNKEHAGMKLKKIAFEMENDFSLRKMSGELDSNRDQTQLQLEIKSGNSRLGLEGFAEAGFLDILSAPEEISKGTLDLEQCQISLRDFAFFMEDLDSLAFYNLLAASQLDVSAKLNIEGPLFTLSECSVSQEKNFSIKLGGNISKAFDLADATGDMHLSVSGLNQVWLEELATASGISHPFPDLSDLKLEGNLSDSLVSPEISLTLVSQRGNMDVIGSLDIQKKLFVLGYSLRGVALGELLAVADLGSFTGAGEIKGMGFSGDELQASFYLQMDTLGFKGYPYHNFQFTGAIQPGVYGLQMVAKDPSMKGDMQLSLELADSAIILKTSGLLQAQLDELNLYGDTLNLQTDFDASLINKGQVLETKLHSRDLTLITPQKTAVVEELIAYFKSDSVRSSFQLDADFMEADLHMVKPLNELDSLGKGYQHYFESFRKASHITANNRVEALPEINATASMSYHDVFDVFMGDSGLHFSRLDASIRNQSDQNSLRTTITGSELSYKMLETEKITAVVTDSVGVILLELLSDSTSLLLGPEYMFKIQANLSNRNMLASLSVNDYGNQDLYLIEVAGRADSNQIFLEIPDQRLILNGSKWQLEDPELLSIDLADNSFYPSLHMKRDSSHLNINSGREDSLITYAMDLNRVELTSLIRNDVFQGSPDGSFTGSIEYQTDGNTEKNIDTDLLISDLSFFGQAYSEIRMEGRFSRGVSDSYIFDLHARTDSLDVQLNAEKNALGEREMKGLFTHFPLVLIEPFVEEYISDVEGRLSGNFDMSSRRGRERFTGQLLFHDARTKVRLLNSVFRIPDQEIDIAEQKVVFDEFTILDTLDRPLKVDGFIEFRGQKSPVADLNITSSELKVMSRKKRSNVRFTGNVFVDSRISITGPLTRPDIGGIIHLSEGSEIFYNHMEDLRMTETDKIVNFVSHSTLGEEIQAPVLSGQGRLGSTSIATVIEIDPSTMINFTLAKRMFDIYLNVKGGGNIQYNQKNEQMALSGRYEIGEGTTLLKLVGWPDKSFRLAEGGFIRWDGMVENPELGLEAENKISTSYVNPIDGRNRDIDFFVILRLTGYLEDLNVLFTVRTPDQYVMSIINTLSPEEQMRQAISVLLFETIDLPGISSSTDYMTQQVNQILSSQMNQFTKSAIKGVDISFGLDTYDESAQDGSSETTTSLSYEVSKTFLNNRAQIEFSGRLKDANQESSSNTDHSLNNLSFEYTLDSAATKYLKIYNEHTYDDVFDGEVIQTGVGFTYRKRYKTFKDIWRRKR